MSQNPLKFELAFLTAIDDKRQREAAKAQRPQPRVEQPTRHEPYRSERARAALQKPAGGTVIEFTL